MFTAYSNLVEFRLDVYDVRLRFAELIHVPNDDDPVWKNQRKMIASEWLSLFLGTKPRSFATCSTRHYPKLRDNQWRTKANPTTCPSQRRVKT